MSYSLVPLELLYDNKISMGAKGVYLALKSASGDMNLVREWSPKDQARVDGYLKELIDTNWVTADLDEASQQIVYTCQNSVEVSDQ